MMRHIYMGITLKILATAVLVLLCIPTLLQTQTLLLENNKVKCTIVLNQDQIQSDKLEVTPEWSGGQGAGTPAIVTTDADFALNIMYTDWQAPGKINNADNPVMLTKKDFFMVNHSEQTAPDGAKELVFDYKGKETSLNLRIVYRLEKDAFFVRRNLAVMDTAFGFHFLRWIWPLRGNIEGVASVIKDGGFGQPVAVSMKNGGAFFGLEYPASENHLNATGKGTYSLECGQEYGEKIGGTWLISEWAVEGITPDPYVKSWFMQYLDNIRVAPLRPYSLYNSWYDLRAPEYPRWSPEKVMSEQSSKKIFDLLRTNMIEKYNMKLDAFVLDDGWDVYESDWVLRKEQWPNGLKPLADELKKTNTSLGIWVGPTGGYSFRMKRVNWMREHGYEVVGKTRDNCMLCLAGKNYSDLFRKRATDFVADDGVGYFKWDGIQFSCSEPNHGHPIDIYSRRAVMESVIDKCRATREKNPDVFLNITSGTWLSPWWVKYANTIWMQGMDYGFSDVPSISQRDGAITYRDFVLYDDFNIQKFWFPIANLMTHGIIKGKHESVGVDTEPLDKFTDDVLLYFARGVSMYELYISPDILTDGEWNAIAKSMAWARDRFPILMNSEMVGGNPLKGETYAHVHFNDKHGIIAARNPVIESSTLKIKLDPGLGLTPKSSSLVLERIYPTRWISPKLFKAGETVSLPLEGFETAVYEMYPLEESTTPLLAGVVFEANNDNGNEYKINYHSVSSDAKLLNPSFIKNSAAKSFAFEKGKPVAIATESMVQADMNEKSKINIRFNLSKSVTDGMVAILLTPDKSFTPKSKPKIQALVDGKPDSVKTEPQEGKSQWYMIDVAEGKHELTVQVAPGKDDSTWQGIASIWIIGKQKQPTKEITFELKNELKSKPMPPLAWPSGEVRKNLKLGTVSIFAK